MTENAPPAGASNAAMDASRGMPYYERLRRDLRESLQKKREIDARLAQIEDTIQKNETSYLEETSAGNIIKGFDSYIKGTTTSTSSGGAGTATRRKAPISDADRIFSRSSTSFAKQDASAPNSATTTPSHAPTPTSSFPTRESSQPSTNGANKNGVNNKKKKAADDDDTDAKPPKRGKITYGRD